MFAQAHAPPLQLISISGSADWSVYEGPPAFSHRVWPQRGSGMCLPEDAVGGGEDPVLVNEGGPTGVAEGGLWTTPGLELR